MDDGFQNFQITKDVSLVVVDAQSGFQNGKLIPAGPLREDVAQGLARANGIVLMGEGTPSLPSFAGPIISANIVPTAPDALHGRSVFAFAGIGQPQSFFRHFAAWARKLSQPNPFPIITNSPQRNSRSSKRQLR